MLKKEDLHYQFSVKPSWNLIQLLVKHDLCWGKKICTIYFQANSGHLPLVTPFNWKYDIDLYYYSTRYLEYYRYRGQTARSQTGRIQSAFSITWGHVHNCGRGGDVPPLPQPPMRATRGAFPLLKALSPLLLLLLCWFRAWALGMPAQPREGTPEKSLLYILIRDR